MSRTWHHRAQKLDHWKRRACRCGWCRLSRTFKRRSQDKCVRLDDRHGHG